VSKIPPVNWTLFRENRATFSWEALKKYDGQWVAFSMDGRRVVASHEDLDELKTLVEAAGETMQTVILECVDFQGKFADRVELG
jgi:hypothetical protein